MARCSTYTGVPLDTWAAILGISPWEFNNCSFPVRKSAQCADVLYQFPWQHDHLSREEIGEAIAGAEQMLANELLYWPYPRYISYETDLYPRPHQRQYFGYAGTPRGDEKSVQLRWKKFIQGGVPNRTAIGTSAAVTIAALDLDGDGIDETFEAVITDAAIADITDPNELGLYFVEDDRHGEPLSEEWRVRPVRVSISGTTATFTGHRTLLVNPNKEFAVNISAFDSALASTFVTELECWRLFTDTSSTDAQPYQGVAEWKTNPGCSQDCTYEAKPLCLVESNAERGLAIPEFGLPCDWPFQDREPDRVRVNYQAGLPLQNGQVDSEYAKVISYLSVSLLANEKCGCDRSNRILERWRKPITRFEDNTNGDNGAVAFTRNNTAFPMTVGGQYAIKFVMRMREVEVVGI